MKKPLFSIILSSYNVEDYLSRCVESFLIQTFNDFEIIIVNDGSTDNTGVIAQKYASQFEFVHCVNKENGGLSSARNAGINAASGTYIHMCDADDWVTADFLEMIRNKIFQFESIHNKMPDVIKFNHYRHIGEQSTLVEFSAEPGDYLGNKDVEVLVNKALESAGDYGLSAGMHIYRKDFLENNELTFISEREVGSEDFLFNLEVLLKAQCVSVLKEAFYYYDLREGSLTQRYRNRLPEQYVCLYKAFNEILYKNGVSQMYSGKFNSLFVWSLIFGTCFVNEYTVINTHTMNDGRKRVLEICSMPEVRKALLNNIKFEKNIKRLILILVMYFKLEPIIYWLFVIKPKKGKR